MFQQQLSKSSLNQEKLNATTISKLNSLMSQISRYIGQRKLDEIKSRALQEAEDDFARETESERGRRKVGWLSEENWTLL